MRADGGARWGGRRRVRSRSGFSSVAWLWFGPWYTCTLLYLISSDLLRRALQLDGDLCMEPCRHAPGRKSGRKPAPPSCRVRPHGGNLTRPPILPTGPGHRRPANLDDQSQTAKHRQTPEQRWAARIQAVGPNSRERRKRRAASLAQVIRGGKENISRSLSGRAGARGGGSCKRHRSRTEGAWGGPRSPREVRLRVRILGRPAAPNFLSPPLSCAHHSEPTTMPTDVLSAAQASAADKRRRIRKAASCTSRLWSRLPG